MDRTTLNWLIGALAVGCAQKGPVEAQSAIDEPGIEADLDRLRALDVVEVAGLNVDGFYRGSCYGMCPEDREEAIAVQGPRLHALADVAERAVARAPSCEGIDPDALLEALAKLQIIDVTGRVVEQPVAEAHCYNQPCAGEVERVEAANCARIGGLAAIVDAAKDL